MRQEEDDERSRQIVFVSSSRGLRMACRWSDSRRGLVSAARRAYDHYHTIFRYPILYGIYGAFSGLRSDMNAHALQCLARRVAYPPTHRIGYSKDAPNRIPGRIADRFRTEFRLEIWMRNGREMDAMWIKNEIWTKKDTK